MKKFGSKKDLWLGFFIFGMLIMGFVLSLLARSLPFIITIILLLILLSWIWFNTNYVIGENNLIIRCGPFRQTIHYQDIQSINKTNNPLASYALSLDRIEIRYGKSRFVLVSPLEGDTFIKEVKKRIPSPKDEII